jgi:hypothetical protein
MVNVNIKEGKMAVPSGLHSELNVLMDTVQVVKELQQLAWTMRPDDKCIIHVVKSSKGLVVRPLQSHFFKVPHEEVGTDME